MILTSRQMFLLKTMAGTEGYVACDGRDRGAAWELERRGLVKWKGTSWGSSFYTITDKGREELLRDR